MSHIFKMSRERGLSENKMEKKHKIKNETFLKQETKEIIFFRGDSTSSCYRVVTITDNLMAFSPTMTLTSS